MSNIRRNHPLSKQLQWITSAALLALIAGLTGAHAMTPEEIRLGFRKHAALAQFHRWYQLYENNAVPIENALDILAADIKLKSGLGEAQGHDAYRQRIAQLPKTWKNAHYVKSVKVTPKAGGTTELSAEITYLNEGLKPGVVRSAELTYSTALKDGDTVLPKFTKVEIAQNSEGTVPKFTDAYTGNRVRSLVHYWLALIEDPSRKIEPFKEIFADGFLLNFSTGKITDFAAFEKWFRGPASTVSASTHDIQSFSYEATSPTEFKMSAEFDWEGILPNSTEMTARTRHTWIMTDNPKDRFPRIKMMDVEVLKPFAPKPKG